MKELRTVSVALIVALGLAFRTEGLVIQFEGNYVASGDDTSTSVIRDIIKNFVRESEGCTNLVEVYKDERGNGSDTGTFASNYTTEYTPDVDDPLNAHITWDGPAMITGDLIYLLVKDGNQSRSALFSWYLYDISEWNGTDDIELNGFWPEQGAFSHVSILRCGDVSQVPDGGLTVSMLGFALAGFGLVRRLRS